MSEALMQGGRLAEQNLIRAPKQDRSQRTMDRIIDATLKLLDERDYDSITIADIARTAKTGTSSIYARFKDKRAILLASHQAVRARAVVRFEALCDPDRWVPHPLQTAIESIIEGLFHWYRDNHNVMKAALQLNDEMVYGEIALSLHAGVVRLSHLLQDRVPGLDRRASLPVANRIPRLTSAAFQQNATLSAKT